jgi:tetratricopeptide (TPR) repeat protein
MKIQRLLLLALCAAACGCKTGTLPDPNDPNAAGVVQAAVLRNSLDGAADAIFSRVRRREISDAQGRRMLAQYANELLASVKIDKVPPEMAWEYADVFRTARRWKEARQFLEVAVKSAKNEDRRVNDSLRLAETMARMGDVKEALPVVRSTFSAPPQEKAPILIGVLLEFVPAARGKGQDVEVARVLEGAIDQAGKTLVDPNTEAGAAFLFARPQHSNRAWATVIELYQAAGRDDLARQAAERAAAWERTRAQV